MANELFTRATSYIYQLTDQQKIELNNSISSKIDPRNATVFSLTSFNEDLKKLSNSFQKQFELSKASTQSDDRKVFVKTANSRNVIFLENTFKECYVPQNYVISYDYMDIGNDENPKILTPSITKTRADNEFNKFFTDTPNDQERGLVPQGFEFLLNFQKNYFSYFSPRTMVFGEER